MTLAAVIAALVAMLVVAPLSSAASPAVEPLSAWGWGVADGKPHYEVCTHSCHRGIAGSGAGQLSAPGSASTDPVGNLFITDDVNHRVDEFRWTGGFARAWGWGVVDGQSKPEICTTVCRTGIVNGYGGSNCPGSCVNEFSEGGYDIAETVRAAPSGYVYTLWYQSALFQQFQPDGTFLRNLGPYGSESDYVYEGADMAISDSGKIFVADYSNERVVVFDANGGFLYAFGTGVADGQNRPEVCTSACRPAIDSAAPSAVGLVFNVVFDHRGHVLLWSQGRGKQGLGGGMKEFTETGQFVKKMPIPGLLPTTNLAGDIFVRANLFGDRIDQFTSDGAFIRGFGWGVADGRDRFEICTSSCRPARKPTNQGALGALDAGRSPAVTAVDRLGELFWMGSDNRIQKFKVSPSTPVDTLPLIRYANATYGHWETTGPAPAGYISEFPLGYLNAAGGSNLSPLYGCVTGTDHFLSRDAGCEGQARVRLEGYIYGSPPPHVQTVTLWRCRITSGGTHFSSTDPNCEGQTRDGPLGNIARYAARGTPPPTCTVPALLGKSRAAALKALAAAHCSLGRVTKPKKPPAPRKKRKFVLVRQEPKAGTLIVRTVKVNIRLRYKKHL